MESKQPLAIVDAASLNLGKFNASAKVPPNAAFRIRNDGDSDLRLIKVILACTCAEARLSATVVKLGYEARHTVALNSGAKTKSPSAQLRVHPNDPRNPTL